MFIIGIIGISPLLRASESSAELSNEPQVLVH